MNVVTKKRLHQFWSKHPDSRIPLQGWYATTVKAQWASSHDVKAAFASADFVGDKRVIFDIGGNNYRLVVRISYEYRQVLIKFIGTHSEYDKIDSETI